MLYNSWAAILYNAVVQPQVHFFPLGRLDTDTATQSLRFQAKFNELHLITLLYGNFPSL